MSQCVCFVIWSVQKVSAVRLVSGVSFMWRCVRLVFWNTRLSPLFRLVIWCVQIVWVCPSCFLVCLEYGRVSALFSIVYKLSRRVRFVFLCVHKLSVCPPCFLLCPEYYGVSACFLVCPEYICVSTLFTGVSRTWLIIRLPFWYVQNVTVCPSCFLV